MKSPENSIKYTKSPKEIKKIVEEELEKMFNDPWIKIGEINNRLENLKQEKVLDNPHAYSLEAIFKELKFGRTKFDQDFLDKCISEYDE